VTVRAPRKAGDAYRGDAPKDAGPEDPRPAIHKVLEGVDGVKSVGEPYEQGGGLMFALETTKDCRAEVSRAVVEAKLDLLKLDYSRSELENTFIRLVEGADASN